MEESISYICTHACYILLDYVQSLLVNKTKNTWASILLEFLSFVLNKLPGQFFFIAFIAPSMQLSQPNVSIFRATCAQLGLNESRQVSRHTKQPATFLPSNIRAKGQGMQWPWKREIWTSGHQIQQSLSKFTSSNPPTIWIASSLLASHQSDHLSGSWDPTLAENLPQKSFVETQLRPRRSFSGIIFYTCQRCKNPQNTTQRWEGVENLWKKSTKIRLHMCRVRFNFSGTAGFYSFSLNSFQLV